MPSIIRGGNFPVKLPEELLYPACLLATIKDPYQWVPDLNYWQVSGHYTGGSCNTKKPNNQTLDLNKLGRSLQEHLQ